MKSGYVSGDAGTFGDFFFLFALKTAGEKRVRVFVCVRTGIIIHAYEVGKVGDKDKKDGTQSRRRLQKVRGRGGK